MPRLLEVTNLSRSFGGVRALNQVSFDLAGRANPCYDRSQRRWKIYLLQPDQRATAPRRRQH